MLRPATAAAAVVVRADVEVASRSEDRVVDVARRAARDAAFVRGAIFSMVLFALSPEGPSERRGERGEERFRALGSGGAGFQLGKVCINQLESSHLQFGIMRMELRFFIWTELVSTLSRPSGPKRWPQAATAFSIPAC